MAFTDGLSMLRFFVAVLTVILLLTGPVGAAGSLRLVVMDGVNLEHLLPQEYPHFHFLMENGALGLANTITAGGASRENAAVTLGCGSRALGPGAGGIYPLGAELDTGTAAAVHARYTGVSAPPGALVLPGINIVAVANSELLHRVQLGYLADSLREAGKTMAALVNGDPGGNYREGAAILAGPDGIVQGGSVETALKEAPTLPFGLQSDLPTFMAALADYWDRDLLVLDLGDTSRTQDSYPWAAPARREIFRGQALAQLDQFLGELLQLHGPDDLLLVVGLQADKMLAREEGKMLVPIIAYGRGLRGLLTSPTTRRPGIVANIDVTATILDFFQLYQPGQIYGQPFRSIERPNSLTYLLKREREMAAVYRLRPPLVKGFIALIVILIVLSLATYLRKGRHLKFLRLLLLAVTASPLVMLALAPVTSSLWVLPAWLTLSGAIALALINLPPDKALTLLGAVTALLVIADALLGAPLQQRSVLGYDAIAGARYYGIGNEYMGALLGSSLLALKGLLTDKKVLAAMILAGITLLLMLPGVGANFGGALAALVGFTVALVGLSAVATKKNRLLAGLSLVGMALVLVLVNLGSNQSHVGRFLAAVLNNPEELWLTLGRKLAMNWKLIRWSQWSKAFAALFTAALVIFVYQRKPLAQRLGRSWPQVRGALTAALAALVFNDSGIVAAATTLLFLTLPLLYGWFSSNSRAKDSHSL